MLKNFFSIWKERKMAIILPIVLFLVSLSINLFFFAWGKAPVYYPDSITYIEPAKAIGNFWWPDFSLRTPTYPLFLLLTSLNNRNYLLSTYIQVIIGALTIVVLYFLIKKFIKKEIPAFIISLFLALDLQIITFQPTILTETLTIFLVLLSLLLHLRFLKKLNLKSTLLILLVDLLLIFTKPTFVLLPTMLWLVALFYKFVLQKEDWQKAKQYFSLAMLAVAINFLAIFGYFLLNFHQSHYFGFSTVSVINDLAELNNQTFLQNNRVYQNPPVILIRAKELQQGSHYYLDVYNLYFELKKEGFTEKDIIALNKFLIKENKKEFYLQVVRTVPKIIRVKDYLYTYPTGQSAGSMVKPLLNLFAFVGSLNIVGFVLGIIFCLAFLLKKKKQKFIILAAYLLTIFYTILVIARTGPYELVRLRAPVEYLIYSLSLCLAYLILRYLFFKFLNRLSTPS